jgi:hypothetical protein
MQYHILVMEAALKVIRSSDKDMPESMILLVDTAGPLLARPPPMAALQGLVSLLQLAYPDRIHQICVGPANFMVRGLYTMASRLISKNSRHKIKLVSNHPKEGYPLADTKFLSSTIIDLYLSTAADLDGCSTKSNTASTSAAVDVEQGLVRGKMEVATATEDQDGEISTVSGSPGEDDPSISSGTSDREKWASNLQEAQASHINDQGTRRSRYKEQVPK